MKINRSVEIKKTPRVQQLEGLFDIPPSKRSSEEWEVQLDLPEKWNVGLIVGPSGSGKTTIANELYPKDIVKSFPWSSDKSVIDDFPESMSIKDIVTILSSVGFSSPPSWLRPFHVLSNGEKFRVELARAICEARDVIVFDEFTSVVDRTVAKIGSACVQKLVRKNDKKFIALSCHYDVAEWLEPDWIYQPHTGQLTVGRSLRRPKIDLEIRRVTWKYWRIFSKHHYLDKNLNKSSTCFCGFVNDVPVCFIAWVHFPHPRVKNIKRIHRLVVLPDYQGIGIGRGIQNYTAALMRAKGFRPRITSSHPAVIHSLNADKDWTMKIKPQQNSGGTRSSDQGMRKTLSTKRMVAAFEYTGRSGSYSEAVQFID